MPLVNTALDKEIHGRLKTAVHLLGIESLQDATAEACEDWLSKKQEAINAKLKEQLSRKPHKTVSSNKSTK